MAQNFWIAIIGFLACCSVTILVSLVTRPKRPEDLNELVYGETKMPHEGDLPWYKRPGPLAIVVGILCVILN